MVSRTGAMKLHGSTPAHSFSSSGKFSTKKKTRPLIVDSVSTTLSSYDPKDPFLAFNALLKLLGSLPYRMGSAQYRLNPEEHKLSIHLLTIIEPFLSSSGGIAGEMRKTLVGQPTEILDSIVFYLDDRVDLLPLALSCRRLYDVIFPRHWNYRIIKAKISSICVWNHISSNKALARNIRYLEVLDERCSRANEVLPKTGITITDTDLESTDDELRLHDKQEFFMISALERMTGLAQFIWSCNHSPIGVADSGIWPTLLRNCASLREIRIKDNLLFSPPDSVAGEEEGGLTGLILPVIRDIHVCSTKHIYGSMKEPSMTRINGILDKCPNIENLKISYCSPKNHTPPPTAHDLLMFGVWPRLRSLSLTNLRPSSNNAGSIQLISTFLSSHSQIEILHLELSGRISSSHPHYQSGSVNDTHRLNLLPNLKELSTCKELVKFILSSPLSTSTARPIHTIQGIHLTSPSASSTTIIDTTLIRLLSSHASTLRKLTLTSWNDLSELAHLAKSIPNLVYLDVGKRSLTSRLTQGDKHSIGGPVNNILEWAMALAGFTQLATFHGVRFFYEVGGQPQSHQLPTVSHGGGILSNPPMTVSTASTTDRSRCKKNDEIASVLAWKCPKLRRVDHWEGNVAICAKVVVLVRDKERVAWEVRRVVKQ